MNLRSRLQKLEEAAGREPAQAHARLITADEQQAADNWLYERLTGTSGTPEEAAAFMRNQGEARP